MVNSRRVAWLHRSHVYHHDRYGHAPCGVLLFTDRYTGKTGTEHQARHLGLRPCRRCFPPDAP